MDQTLIYIIAATVFNSLIALVGIFTFLMDDKKVNKLIFVLVSFSAGALLGGALLHLLPEAIERLPVSIVAVFFIIGFMVFFVLERLLRWHHCHDSSKPCETHPFTTLILLGDSVHNFIDGLVIAAAFIVDVPFGILTTGLIIAHEVPQELGDYGVLIYGGMGKKKALFFNLVSQMTCIAGGILGWLLSGESWFVPFLLSLAGGGFLYIAASDLIPELHKEADLKKSTASFFFMCIGVLLLLFLKG